MVKPIAKEANIEFHKSYFVYMSYFFTIRSTWEYLRALLKPKFLLSSASLSDASLIRVCGMYE